MTVKGQPASETPRRQPMLLPGLLLLLPVLVAYHRVVHAGFIWDDDMHLTANPCIVGPQGFIDIWTSPHARIGPLVISSFWLEHRLWGLSPLPYHIVNVALHAVNALLLWRVLGALHIRGAWLGAALWALHPVQVETVAWITELKNTQSCLSYLLAVLCFVRWLEARRRGCPKRDYFLALVFSALAMASKSSTVVLPVMLGLCWWWLDRRWQWRNALWLAPILLLSGLSSALSIWTQTLEGGISDEWQRTVPERLITAGKVVWFYLGKLAWPHPLIFIYPRWDLRAGQVVAWSGTAALVAVMLWLWWKRDSDRWRPAFFSFISFVTALVPVLGLVDHYFLRYSFVGDHFQYLASMAPLAWLGAGISVGVERLPIRSRRWSIVSAAALLVVGAVVVTIRYTGVFQNSTALWSDTLAKNPQSWMAWNNLGLEHVARGANSLAREHFERALAIFSGNAEAQNNLAGVLVNEGRLDDAISHCRTAIELDANCVDARLTLARALFEKGDHERAIEEWRLTIERLPALAEARASLAAALLQGGHAQEAIAECEAAIRSAPANATAHNTLGAAMLRLGRLDEAVRAYEKAVDIDGRFAAAQYNLAQALRQAGRTADAIPHYEKAAELLPDAPRVLNNFAWTLATCPDEKRRDPKRAHTIASHASAIIQGRDPLVFRTLAAASAALGDFVAADQEVRLGLHLAESSGDSELVAALNRDRERYQKSLPVIDPAPTR